MTFESILSGLLSNTLTPRDAYDAMKTPEKMKAIAYYVKKKDIDNEPFSDGQLQQLGAIVKILQILYNSDVDSPVNDSWYDSLQETLIDMGIPRLTGSIEINTNDKVSHRFVNLRGTLDKVYYLSPDEKRTNKSRKYLDDWIRSTEALYERNTGKKIDLNNVKIMLQCKFDGTSVIMEDGPKPLWLTRGDTKNNKASDVSHVMDIFNDKFSTGRYAGIKYEVMMTEENKDKINELYKSHPYHNSRQIVTSILNSNEVDFKAEYLYPVPLRIMYGNDKVEQIHPMLIEKFPTQVCTFGDRDTIREFANKNRYANVDGMRFRTDGVVMTILDDDIKIALGRDNDINNFEVAYKFTEEAAYTRVKNVDFEMGNFGTVTPVLIVNEIILKGNKISRISLSNKQRFDELSLCYGDEVKVLYDIIPYVTIDERCRRVPNGRKIDFTPECPKCHKPLDLNSVMVQCKNPTCPSREIGRIQNYCTNLRMQNIGYKTLEALYENGYLDKGIFSLYKLKTHTDKIQNIEGFGKIKIRRIVSEIESKRRLKDSDFFGAIGIQGSSIKTFEMIFDKMKSSEFINLYRLKNFDLMIAKLVSINGIGDITARSIVNYLKDDRRRKELDKLLKEVNLEETFNVLSVPPKGIVVFTGCRADADMKRKMELNGWKPKGEWTVKASYLVVPNMKYESRKVNDAKNASIPIVTIDNILKKLKIE